LFGLSFLRRDFTDRRENGRRRRQYPRQIFLNYWGDIPRDGEIVALNMTPGLLFGGAVWSRDMRFANALVFSLPQQASVISKLKRRSSVNFGGKTFLPENVCMKN